MTDSLQSLLKDVINLLEQCPVTSDTDWIFKRNDIIFRSRQVIRELKSITPKENLTVVHETAPKQIWLHLNGANEWLPFKDYGDVIWSQVRIDGSDIPYVRDDYTPSLENELVKSEGGMPIIANVESVGRCYAEAFSKSKAEHSPNCNDALHRDAARWAVYQMGIEDGIKLARGFLAHPTHNSGANGEGK